MVTLKALEAAITQVEKLRDHEFAFEAGGMQITLRPLRSHEETEVQRYAQVAWEGVGEEGDPSAYQDFMDRVRVATLGFSIVQLGDTDLRGVEYVETGERDEKGQSYAVPKWEAIRDLISAEWTRPMMLQVFAKFGELLERVEISASRVVRFDPADLDEEIDRLEKRLNDLKRLKEGRESPEQSAAQQAQKAVAVVDRRHVEIRNDMRSTVGPTAAAERERRAQEATDTITEGAHVEEQPAPPREAQARRPEPPPAREVQPPAGPSAAPPRPPAPQAPPRPPGVPQGRQSAIPEQVPAPERGEEVPPPAPEQSEEAARMLDEQGIELPHEGDSFFDPSDPDAAIQAEARRQAMLHHRNLQKQRERKMAAQKAEALGVPTSADLARQRLQAQRDSANPKASRLDVDPRTAGLRQAANLQDHLVDTGAGRVRRGAPQPPQPQPDASRQVPAKLHGKDVYKMPTQTLDRPERRRQHGEPPESPVQINPAAGGVQDKFRGPGQQ